MNKTMMTSTSDQTVQNFRKWLQGWDATISTYDDRETQEMIRERLHWCMTTVNDVLAASDNKAMNQFPDQEGKIKAMIQNQEKKRYKELKKVRDIITTTMYQIENLFELKNRKTHEVFRLRAELANERNKK